MVEGETHQLEPGHVLLDRTWHLPVRTLRRRIEDIVAVTEDGGLRLNNTTREMQIVA